MNRTTSRIVQKIKENSGESLGETLVALLISALAMVMLVSMNDASGRMISKSIDTVTQYQAGINALASQNADDRTSAGTAVFLSDEKAGETVTLDAAAGSGPVPVLFFEAPKSFGTPVISYKRSGN